MLAAVPKFLSRAKVVVTVHGLDADRAKWGGPARIVLRFAQWLSARVPDVTIVVSKDLETYYRDRHQRRTVYIPNGVSEPTPRPPQEITDRFGLRGDDYFLFVGRMVPEKAPDLLIRAFRRLETDRRLVLAGGSSYTDEYLHSVEALAASDARVLMPGYVYGQVLEELYANASAFVIPSSLEGLPLTLLEAASYGIPLVVSDIRPHLEVVGDDGPGHRTFRSGDERSLAATLRQVLTDPRSERRAAKTLREVVLSSYSWGQAVDGTEAAYASFAVR